ARVAHAPVPDRPRQQISRRQHALARQPHAGVAGRVAAPEVLDHDLAIAEIEGERALEQERRRLVAIVAIVGDLALDVVDLAHLSARSAADSALPPSSCPLASARRIAGSSSVDGRPSGAMTLAAKAGLVSSMNRRVADCAMISTPGNASL